MIGLKIGRLSVVSLHAVINKNSHYKCECECGNTTIVSRPNLRNNHTMSCGCLNKEMLSVRSTTHGKSRSNIYKVWNGMLQRCSNTSNMSFKYYGGRGISVCADWAVSFESFYNWAVQNGFKKGLSIDRINNNGNYEPSNCRWVELSVQSKNRRKYFFEQSKGVFYDKNRNKWVASLGGKSKRFSTIEEALEQREVWKNEIKALNSSLTSGTECLKKRG